MKIVLEEGDGYRTHLPNYNAALSKALYANKDNPLYVMSFLTPEDIILRKGASAKVMFSIPGVYYVQLPDDCEKSVQLPDFIDSVTDSLRLVACELLHVIDKKSVSRTLIQEKLNSYEFKCLSVLCKHDFLGASPDEVVFKLKKFLKKTNKSGQIATWYYYENTICCDIKGTLLENNSINKKMIFVLDEHKKNGKEVVLWSSGNEHERKQYEKLLKNYGFGKVHTKQSFEGSRIFMAYDDMKQQEFEDLYGIVVDNYIKVKK